MNELFCDWTFVDGRWSILAHTLRSEASASRMGAMHAWRYSWNLSLTLVMSRRAAEKEAVTWTFKIQLDEKHERQSFLSFKHLLSGRNLKSVLRQASCALASKQAATGDASSSSGRGSILLGLVWLISGSSKSFPERTTCSSCALCALCPSFCRQASLCILPSHTHTAATWHKGAGAVSTSSSAVPFTTNNMERRAAQAFATTTDWQSNRVSKRRSTRKWETGDFLRHAQEFVYLGGRGYSTTPA